MNNKIKTSIVALGVTALLSSVNANACDCKHKKEHTGFYIGVEGGLSAPIPNTFKKKMDFSGQKVTIEGKLSNSAMYGALLGYKFYPGMAAEFSYQHKPNYKLNITLPDTNFSFAGMPVTAKKNSAKVKVTSDLYLIGLVYDLAEVKGLTPYVGVELGVANIKAKSQTFYSDIALQANGAVISPHTEVMRIKKSNSIRPAFQLSVGATKENIIKNVNLYAAARVQLIMEAKLKYDLIANGAVSSSGKLKQSLLISEVVMGLTYNLPF